MAAPEVSVKRKGANGGGLKNTRRLDGSETTSRTNKFKPKNKRGEKADVLTALRNWQEPLHRGREPGSWRGRGGTASEMGLRRRKKSALSQVVTRDRDGKGRGARAAGQNASSAQIAGRLVGGRFEAELKAGNPKPRYELRHVSMSESGAVKPN